MPPMPHEPPTPEWMGCCLACGYDRRGLADDARCPECGAPARAVERPTAPSGDPQYGQTWNLFSNGWILLGAAMALFAPPQWSSRLMAGMSGGIVLFTAGLVSRSAAKKTIRYLLPRLHAARTAAFVAGGLLLAAAVAPSAGPFSLPVNRLLVAAALPAAGLVLWQTLWSFADLAERWGRPWTARWCRWAAVVAPPLAAAEAVCGIALATGHQQLAFIGLIACSVPALSLFVAPLLLHSPNPAARPPGG